MEGNLNGEEGRKGYWARWVERGGREERRPAAQLGVSMPTRDSPSFLFLRLPPIYRSLQQGSPPSLPLKKVGGDPTRKGLKTQQPELRLISPPLLPPSEMD